MYVDFETVNLKLSKNVYKQIGSGSGRRVFDLGNGYVVKVAKNKKGFAQNDAEYQIFIRSRSELLAKIPQISEDNKFLLMEKAEKIKRISEVLTYFNVRNYKELFRRDELKILSSQYSLLLPDLIRAVNWGRINGKIVIIDYGFTQKVREKYYSVF